MTTQMINRERLAWDSARALVRVLGSAQVTGWLHGQMAAQLGPASAAALAESRRRLFASPRADAPQVEAGIWRARLLDLLATDDALAGPLRELTAEAHERLAVAADVQVPGQAEHDRGPRVIDLDHYRAS
ncbi:hypothetical protein [Phytohabitans kaempferiae]|uniref:Uncharacterized protein n=1 Tax=Phytohabitans kaempferiae TaxID=1620943 RepID=A0ABV6LZ31_9ACTN